MTVMRASERISPKMIIMKPPKKKKKEKKITCERLRSIQISEFKKIYILSDYRFNRIKVIFFFFSKYLSVKKKK